jgi:dUTP pyrophosphatase
MMTETPIFKFAICDYVGPLDLTQKHFLPTKAHREDSGWDVRSSKSISLRAGQYARIPLGFRMFAPAGWWLELRPRSSSFAKKQLHCLYGVIDNHYENELMFACQYIPDVSALGNDLVIEFGEAIGQIIPIRRQEMLVENISNEEFARLTDERKGSRGIGGFGSSG